MKYPLGVFISSIIITPFIIMSIPIILIAVLIALISGKGENILTKGVKSGA